ncbi:MAG TPA: hypothetical protein PLU30_07045 [Verrucomicrobiae bacterium]|nr:hypothetical protein [Verrucomicrobiae bacterium]
MKTKCIHNIDCLTAAQREYLALRARGVEKSKAVRIAQHRTHQTLRTKGLDEDALLKVWKRQYRLTYVTGVPVTNLVSVQVPAARACGGTRVSDGRLAMSGGLHGFA